MSISANNPSLKSWVEVPTNSDFSIQNLPFGIIKTPNLMPRVAVRIGDKVLDLKTLFVLGYLENLPYELGDFDSEFLNKMMKRGKKATRDLRNRISKLLDVNQADLQKNQHHVDQVLLAVESVEMCMPIQIGDYTDFYSSKEHATNVGVMFRDPANALLPNWLWIPVGYHGRASSVVLSGQSIYRPKGQVKPVETEDPIFAPSSQLDFELEMGFFTYDGKPLGDSISTAEAEEFIFGMCLFNDSTWRFNFDS